MIGVSRHQETELQAILSRSPIVAAIVDRWSDIRLPDCWLVARLSRTDRLDNN